MLPPPAHRKTEGFTLIELLVVVSIIAVLAAILLPVFSSVTLNGRKTQVANDEKNILTAIVNYRADNNNHMPMPAKDESDKLTYNYDTVFGDPGDHVNYHNSVLFNILRGKKDDAITDVPGTTSYIDEPFVKDPINPRSGILRKEFNDGNYKLQAGSFVDPWGGEYIIFADTNRDGDLNVAISYIYPSWPKDPGYGPHGVAAVVSVGPDGDVGKTGNQVLPGSDDIPYFQ